MRSPRTIRALVTLFLVLGLVEGWATTPRPEEAQWRASLVVLCFWVARAAAVPFAFAIDRVLARRVWAGLVLHLVVVEVISFLSGLAFWLLLVAPRPFPVNAFTPVTAPITVVIYVATAAAAAALRLRREVLREEIERQDVEAQLAERTFQAMRGEVHGPAIVASLDDIEQLLEVDRSAAEREITLLSDFLQSVMIRVGCDRVPLRVELKFAAAALRLNAFRARTECEVLIEDEAPAQSCEPGVLRDLIDAASGQFDGFPARVAIAARAKGSSVVVDATFLRGGGGAPLLSLLMPAVGGRPS